jgi:hypothetical protein
LIAFEKKYETYYFAYVRTFSSSFNISSKQSKSKMREMHLLENLYKIGEVSLKGRLSTVDLLVLTSSDQLLLILKILFTFITIQATLMWRSTVQSLHPRLVFLDQMLTNLLVQVGDPFRKLPGVGDGGRQENVVDIVRQQDDRLLPDNAPFLVSHVVDLVEDDPADFASDFRSAVEH